MADAQREPAGAAEIGQRYRRILQQVATAAARAGRDPAAVRVIAVSKKHPPSAIEQAVAADITDFGENFVQELIDKQARLSDIGDVRWHFIGRLQRNKVKYLVGKVDLIHAVDSERLALEIGKRAAAAGVVQRVLIAVNIAEEDSKSGLGPADLPEILGRIDELDGIVCAGLMTMPPLAADPDSNRVYFRQLRELRDTWVPQGELSMGTTQDFAVAVEEGATLVRVGTAIFGPRPQPAAPDPGVDPAVGPAASPLQDPSRPS